MKRLLILLCALLLAGCTQKEPPIQSPVTFYYLQTEITYGSEASILGQEIFEGAGHEQDIRYLLNVYLLGPTSPALSFPIPQGTVLVDFSVHERHGLVILSNQFAKLTGIDLTATCACITKTLLQLADIDSVEIQCTTESLGDTGTVIMDEAAILLLDDAVTQ